MARSRSASFSDDDLQIVSSQALSSQRTADMSMNSSPAKSPLQQIQPNRDALNLPSASTDTEKGSTGEHFFGKPSKMNSLLYKKVKSVFNPNKNRPEHHRPKQITGPSAPQYQDVRAAQPQFFSTVGMQDSLLGAPADQQAPQHPLNGYSQPTTVDYADVQIYTDPTKASADLKALLEGGMEDEEEEKEMEGGLDDGVVEGVKVKLLPHQVEGVKWMKGRELGPVKRGKVPKGGILADDMGLGKTLQAISLILSNPKPTHDEKGWKKHYDSVEKTTLVVAPLALIRQWEAEIKDKVTKDHRLNVLVHHGPQRTKRFQDLARYDVVVTTYQILVSEHGHSNDTLKAGCFGLHWYRVILDEAHSIKNRNAKATKACCALQSQFRWCLTGTPMQNNLDELQSLVHFLQITPYNDLKEWRAHIDAPMKNGKGHIAIRRLHSILRCFMKRRTKDILKEEGALVAGGKKALKAATEDGEKEMPVPAFKVTERNIVTIEAVFSPAERQFYDRLEQRAEKSLDAMMEGKVNYANALVLLLRLRQACNHPRLVGGDLGKDQEALSTDAAPKKGAGDDLDGLADVFGEMGIETKRCDVCMSQLTKKEKVDGRSSCTDCTADRETYDCDSPERKRSKKKKIKKVVKEMVKVEKKERKQRNRRAIVDSDDEDEEASWLVPEDQRGSLRLGKAGGKEDEDADGGGEWINPNDSVARSDDDDNSRLDSFVVNDENFEEGAESDSDASLISISKFSSQVVPKALQQSIASESDESDSAGDDSGVSESELDSSSDELPIKSRKTKKKVGAVGQVLASAKIRQLVELLHRETDQHKFIVFSQFTSMLDLMEPFLRKEGFKFVRYDGKMKNDAREESLRCLRTDARTRILLCSLKCGSLGLNLTAATRVVILEPFWNPFVEEQAIDRVHRLTQTVDVTVYKLTVEKTVERRILDLQDKKRLLAETAIEGGMRKKDGLKLGLNEILELFKHSSERVEAHENGEFVDAGMVRQDVQGMLGSYSSRGGGGGPGAKSTKERDPTYGRRW